MRVASVSPRGDGPWPERVDHGGGPAPLGTFRRCSGIEGPRARRLLAEVEAWLASDASDWPFAFVSVCETLGLDPDYIRRGIRQWAARRKAVALGRARIAACRRAALAGAAGGDRRAVSSVAAGALAAP